jgi:hypothetical protein
MAEGVLLNKSYSVFRNQTIRAYAHTHCESCNTLKSEFEETVDELNSARLMIILLWSKIKNGNNVSTSQDTDALTSKKFLSNIGDQIDQNSARNNLSGSMKEHLVLEAMLDRRELREFCSMAVHPGVQQLLLKAISNLEDSQITLKKTPCSPNGALLRKSYSEALRHTKVNEESNSEVISTIPTVITSKTTVGDDINKQNTLTFENNITHNRLHKDLNDERNKSVKQPEKCKILTIGDSHIKDFLMSLGKTWVILMRYWE